MLQKLFAPREITTTHPVPTYVLSLVLDSKPFALKLTQAEGPCSI